MKKYIYAITGMIGILMLIYFMRGKMISISLEEYEALSHPVAAFENSSPEFGEPLVVRTLGYPWGMDLTYRWFIDGVEIENTTNSYTPQSDDLEKFLTVKVIPEDETYDTTSISVFLSKLPVFYIDTENEQPINSKQEYRNGTLLVQGNGQYQDAEMLYEGNIQIKGRGNTTWNNTDKKSYHLKLELDAALLGMGAENDWTMLANPFDATLMRNALAYDLSGVFGLAHLECTWVDVVLNGEYVGNYLLCEKMEADDDRVDITDWEEFASSVAKVMVEAGQVPVEQQEALKETMRTDLSWLSTRTVIFDKKELRIPHHIEIPELTGGFLLELDMYFDEISKFNIDNQHIMFQEPKYAATNEELFQYTIEYMTAFYDAAFRSEDFYAVYQGEEKHYSEFFDMDSLVTFYLIQEIFFNEDGNGKSSFFYKDVGELAQMGPIWDMDWSSAGEGANSYRYDEWQTTFYSAYCQVNQWYKGLVKDPYFLSQAKKYWDMYREDIFMLVEDGGVIDQHYEYLYESGLANDELWQHREGFKAEVTILKEWMINRLNWLDQQFGSLQTLVDSIGSFEYGVDVDIVRDNRDVLIRVENETGSYAVIYVDGLKQAMVPLVDGMASYTLNKRQPTASETVVQVRVYNAQDEQIGSNYIDNR